MLECPRCTAPLVLTAPTCACGQDVREAAEGVGLVCGACEAWSAAGTPACAACGEAFGTANPTTTANPTATTTTTTTAPTLQRTGRGAQPLRLVSARGEAELGDAPVLCGRADVDLVVPGETVSARHARFLRRDGRPLVEDLGSRNGTWLRLRAPRPLALGDELRLGARRLRFAWTPGGHALEELDAGGAAVATHPLRPGPTVLGTGGDLPLPGLEPRHARLEPTLAGHVLSDLGSRAGSWVRLVAPEPVAAGDEVRLGAEWLRIEAARSR